MKVINTQFTKNHRMSFITNFICIFILLCRISTSLTAQEKNYFQQAIQGNIEAILHEATNEISGSIEYVYQNNSPQQLDTIYFHVWMNAFGSKQSAFARQELEMGSTNFYFATPSEMGGYSKIKFEYNNQECKYTYWKGNRDIVWILIPGGVASGKKANIRVTFREKLPKVFSRPGVEDGVIYATQWFPKPAVYDRMGWHLYPYLNLGEFYSEFGDWTMQLDVPAHYLVAATGDLLTKSEQDLLDARVKIPLKDQKGLSLSGRKVLEYSAKNVHDLAWVAGAGLRVQRATYLRNPENPVQVYSWFVDSTLMYEHSSIRGVQTIQYMSEQVGPYPWNQMHIVHGRLKAGGGMEYPQLTILQSMKDTSDLARVISHEINHNWFYGILAFDERRHPWLDEGFTSYYEDQVVEHAFHKSAQSKLDSKTAVLNLRGDALETYLMAIVSQSGFYHPRGIPSHQQSGIEYLLNAYVLPPQILKSWEAMKGREEVNAAMQHLFAKWKFKHPSPEETWNSLQEKATMDLQWIPNQMYATKGGRVNYAIKALDAKTLTIKNKGNILAPVKYTCISPSGNISTHWLEGFNGLKKIEIGGGDTMHQVVLNEGYHFPEMYTCDNTRNISGLFKRPWHVGIPFTIGRLGHRNLSISPLLAWNGWDGWMPGIFATNLTLPAPQVRFTGGVLWGSKSKSINHQGSLSWHHFPEGGPFHEIMLGIMEKSFTYFRNTSKDYALQYHYLRPTVQLRLRSNSSNSFHAHRFRVGAEICRQENAEFHPDTTVSTNHQTFIKPILSYGYTNDHPIHGASVLVELEHESYKDAFQRKQNYLLSQVTLQYDYQYKLKRKMHFRWFAGTFLKNTRRKSGSVDPELARNALALSYQSAQDDLFGHNFFHRGTNGDFISRQVLIKEGGFKVNTGSAYSDGLSNDLVASMNFYADLPEDLPLHLPLRPYFDIGYAHDATPLGKDKTFSEQVWWQGGLMIGSPNSLFAIYIPIINSKNLEALYDQEYAGKFLPRISWSFYGFNSLIQPKLSRSVMKFTM